MNWNEKLQKIVDCVELHLQCMEEAIDVEEIAEIAGCSFSFFQKVFSYMNGISFSEYVRSRKLTLAGYDLKSTDMKVLEISYKYGYDSPTSFAKAFQKFHGVTPTEARKRNVELKITPKMQVTSDKQYSWKLEKKPQLRLIGKKIQFASGVTLEKSIPQFWSDCRENGIFQRLLSLDRGSFAGMFGLFMQNEGEPTLSYSIMVLSDQELPEGFQEIILSPCTWAIFDCHGPVPLAIQAGWKYLEEEWFIQYPFSHLPLPELEWYQAGNPEDSNYLSQIWIPIEEIRGVEKDGK